MNNEKVKNILKSEKIPILIFMVAIIVLHFFIQKENDDLYFSSVCDNIGLFEYIGQRYNVWTSRIIIEGILVIFCNFLPIEIWKIANIGMYGLLIYSILKLFVTENKKKLNWVLVISIALIPITILKEAGWMATMNNYLWVAATGLYAMIPIRKIIKDEKINVIQGLSFVISAIYASNQEQMAGILFLVYTFFLIYIIKNKKQKPIVFVIYTIIILNLILIMVCPGNANRKILEEETWYPGYSELSISSKLAQGLTSMMYYVIDSGNILFYGFIALITYTMWKSNKDIKYKLLGMSPIVLVVIFDEVKRISIESKGIEALGQFVPYILFKICVYLLILISIGICLYYIFCKKKEKDIIKFTPLLIYIVGILSRYVMAFSPTIYASGERTSLFWYISLSILIILLFREKIFKFKKGEKLWESLKR